MNGPLPAELKFRENTGLAQAALLSTNCCMPKLFLNNIILGRILMLIMGIEIG